MRVSLFLLSLACLAGLSSAAMFTQQTLPPWNPRILQGWAFPSTAVTYNNAAGVSTTAPAGTSNVIAWGGNTYNDTYLSTDSGNTWTLIGGTAASTSPTTGKTVYSTSPHPATFNCDDSDCCKTYDPTKGIYYVVDSFAVYTSSNGLDWTTVGGTEFAGRQSAYCLVDKADSDLFVIGGQNTTGSDYENDIYLSVDSAVTFTQVNTAPWSQRDSQNGWVHQAPLGKTVLYAIGGHAAVENTRPNEVWVSSDNAQTWTLLSNGQFPGRDHLGAAITSTGIMLIVGGKLQATNSGGKHLGANDVWASLDGGVNYGFCGNAEWPVRQDHRVAIDANDFLYVTGGTSNNATASGLTLNDVWKSTMSYKDAATVATACGLTSVSACGVGLRCFPNATTVTTGTTSAGATYPVPTVAPYSCPCSTATGSSATPSPSSSGATGVIVPSSSGSSQGNGAASSSSFGVVAALALLASTVASIAL